YMDVLYGIENPLFMDLKHGTGFIFKTLLPWLPRFLLTIRKINRLQYPVEEYLASVIKDPSLRDIISQHFFKNTPTFFALSYFSLYLDYFYPKGGVGRLAEVLRDRILELGGEIRTDTLAAGVSPADKTVTDHNGISYTYKNLIWAADLKTLYRTASAHKLPAAVKARFESTKGRLLQNRGADSVFTLFLEVDEPLESFAQIARGHFFYTPSRQGLGETHRGELQELLRNFEHVNRQRILVWLDNFISLNTFEISIPGLKDRETSSEGQTGVIVSFLAEFELFQKVEAAGWLQEFVTGIEERVIKVLSESVYPMLQDKVISRFSYSPLSIRNRIASSEGAIVGWEFQPNMPVINQIQIAGRSVLTPLPAVYQAGQWAYSPAGVPMSILTGKLAANRIIKSRE
ncbi:MAG: FAD-dependent oxidoreductase, partial [Candidatus Cloacimonetes bacterium]|nr:FAD-dependent oxidoreductase [Candidatus Cloacimonadota bacterium]